MTLPFSLAQRNTRRYSVPSPTRASAHPTMEALRKQHEDLNAALAASRRELRKTRAQARRARASDEAAWKLGSGIVHAVLIMYGLARYNVSPAVKFLAGSARKRHWPSKSDEELGVFVEDLFLQSDPAEFDALQDTEAPSDPVAMKLAVDVVQEWRLAAWTQDLNYTKGVAPRTEAVLRQLEQARQALPEAVRPAHRGDVYHPPARVWAARWRKRWGGRHGRLRVREAIPVDDMRSKVCPASLASQDQTRTQNRVGLAAPNCIAGD